MKKLILFSLILLFLSQEAFARENRCPMYTSVVSSGQDIFGMTTYHLTPFYGTTDSTAQTTYGKDCKRLRGYLEGQRMRFVADNFETIVQESSKGMGPHLNALATLFGCQQTDLNHFSIEMHNNHDELFNQSIEDETLFLQKLKGMIYSNHLLQTSCNI